MLWFWLQVTASDLGTPPLSSSTTARMFKIRDANRMVLVVNKAGVTEAEIGEYRDLLQQIIGKDIIIGQYRIHRSFCQFHPLLFILFSLTNFLNLSNVVAMIVIWALQFRTQMERICGNTYKLNFVLRLWKNCNFLLSLWLIYLILLTSQRGQPLGHC